MKPILTEVRAGHLRLWEMPLDGHEYVVGVDVAEGKIRDRSASARRKLYSYSNEQPDYTSATVVDLETGKHVASWHGKISPDQFVGPLVALAKYYNQALLVPEVNGPGIVIVIGLRQAAYPRVYRSKVWIHVDRDVVQDELGWRTSATNRPLLIARVSEWLQHPGMTRDAGLVDELRTMQFDASGTPRARGHNKDDRVFSLALALQGRHELLSSSRPQDRVDATPLSPDDRAMFAIEQAARAELTKPHGINHPASGRHPVSRRRPLGRG